MAGTINYLYDVNQQVYVIANCSDSITVLSGTIKRIRGIVLDNTSVAYDIQLVGSQGTSSFDESDVFSDSASAIAEYSTRITV